MQRPVSAAAGLCEFFIGVGHFFVIAVLFIARAVVAEGKTAPVFFTYEAHEVVGTTECGKQFELVSLRTVHLSTKLVDTLTAALAPIETANLEHPPETAFKG